MAFPNVPSNFSQALSPPLPRELHPFRLLNEKQVAELTGIGVQTLRNSRCRRRGLPYVKISKSIRYQLADILAFIEGRRIDPEAG